MGLFSSISSFVKKAVKAVQPLAAVAASFTPVGVGAGIATGLLGIKNPLAIDPRAAGSVALGTRGPASVGTFLGPPLAAPAAAPGLCPCPQPAAAQRAPVRTGFRGFSIFGPRPAFPQQAVSPGFVRPTFRAFQPVFSPDGKIQNTSNGMFQFQRTPGRSIFAGSFAGFGGKFNRFGSFNRRVSPQQRAANFPDAPIPSGRALNAESQVVGVKPFFPIQTAQALPARASFVTPVVKQRLNQPAPPAGRAAAIAVQSQPVGGGLTGIRSFFQRKRRLSRRF